MPTREEISVKIQRDFADRGLDPGDPIHAFALESLESFNRGVADLDDELADIAARLEWLATAATWMDCRAPGEFEAFVVAKLSQCDTAIGAIRSRWEQHLNEARSNAEAEGARE